MKFGGFQSLRDKLLPKGEAKAGTFPLAAYGKLTLYKDYINLECNDGPAAEFKSWMDKAFGMTFEQFGGRSVTLDFPSRMLLSLQGGKSYAVATIWPSTDEGGLRKFPFSFFTVIPKSTLAGKSVPDGLLLLNPIWRAIDACYQGAKGLANIEAFYQEFRGQRLDSQPDPAEESQPLAPGEWIRSFAPDGVAGYPKRLTGMVAALIAACRDLSDVTDALAIRLPVAQGLPFVAQLAAWERAFRENIKKCPPWPSMVLPSEPSADHPTICLIWREIQKDDARLFGSDVGDYDKIEDIAGEAAKPTDETGAEEEAELGDLDSWIAGLGKTS